MSATFEEAIQPLLDAYAALDADMREKEAELAELKEMRNRLRNAVRAVAPERAPGDSKAAKNGHNRKYETRYSEASLTYVREFVTEHMTGVFGTSDLISHQDYEGVGGSTLPHILRRLHETDVLRLVKTGKGSSRYYEVIR